MPPPRISWPFFLGGFPEARPVAEEREVVEPWHPETAHPIGSLESWSRFMNHNHPLRKSQAAEAEDPWSTGWPFPVFMSMMARFVFCVLRTCCVARSWSMVDRPPRKCSKSRIFRCFWKNSGGISLGPAQQLRLRKSMKKWGVGSVVIFSPSKCICSFLNGGQQLTAKNSRTARGQGCKRQLCFEEFHRLNFQSLSCQLQW